MEKTTALYSLLILLFSSNHIHFHIKKAAWHCVCVAVCSVCIGVCFQPVCEDVCVALLVRDLFLPPCWHTCACSDNCGRWKGLCTSYIMLSSLYEHKDNPPSTHTHSPLYPAATGERCGGWRVHIPGRGLSLSETPTVSVVSPALSLFY